MHHALELEEILLDVFGHCYPPGLSEDDRRMATSSLAALARTCRAFKESALDVLWSELNDLSPVSRCLPEISYAITSRHQDYSTPQGYKKLYGFRRPLEQAQWEILQSYTRRIWCIRDFQGGLDWNSVKTFANSPTADSLFPNLRSLQCDYGMEAIPFLHLPFPSLTLLSIGSLDGVNPRMPQDPLKSFAKFSPNIRKLDIWGCQPKPTICKIVSDCICCWQNLQIVYCPEISLDVDALTHLSCMPMLTRLTFVSSAALADQIIPSDLLFPFSSLRRLNLHSRFLASISRRLSRTQLPVITEFTTSIETCPSRADLALFLASVQTSMGHTIQDWNLSQSCNYEDTPPPLRPSGALLLGLDDLRACMAFSNLRRMTLDLQWNVGLTDSELLVLASAWPKLERLLINSEWGWNTLGGITPDGVERLLKTCQSLNSITLAIDTRGYTELPPRQSSLTLTAMRNVFKFSLDVVDSVIEEESVPAIAAFLAGVVPQFDFIFTAWDSWAVIWHPENGTYGGRWRDVYDRANMAVKAAFLSTFRQLYEAPLGPGLLVSSSERGY